MCDVAIKVEVGVLNFRQIATRSEDEKQYLYKPSLKVVRIEKLLIKESDMMLESGLAIRFSDGQFLRVVPSAFPCHLVVSGLLQSTLSVTEYPEDKYETTEFISVVA